MNNPAGIYHFGSSHEENVSSKEAPYFYETSIGSINSIPRLEDSDLFFQQYIGLFGVTEFRIDDTIPFKEEAKANIEAWQYLSASKEWRESEKDILPILEFINSIPGIVTTDACSGHDDIKGVHYFAFISDTKERGYYLLTKLAEYIGLDNIYEIVLRPGFADIKQTEEGVVAYGRVSFQVILNANTFKETFAKFNPKDLENIKKELTNS